MNNSIRAQGTIEYLVIIGVVIVLSLAVAGTVVNLGSQAGAVSESTAKAAWLVASPFSITEWSVGTDGIMTIVLKNVSFDTLAFNSLNIGTDWNNTPITGFSPGTTKIIRVTTGDTRATGDNYSYKKTTIQIDYNGRFINNQIQIGASDFVGKVN